MNKSVLAIDPGYDRIGAAVFSGNDLLHSECFIPETKEFTERLSAVSARVQKLIQEFTPDALAMETLFFSKNVKTALNVAEARGAMILTGTQNNVPLFEYSPQEIKIAVTSVGNADKKQVIYMVEKLVQLEPKKRFDDEYDAIAVGICHQAQQKFQK